MHSRIFQLSTHPILEDDYITESDYDYEHWFSREIADYVADTDRTGSINWFRDCTNSQGITFDKDENGEFAIITDKRAYFKKDYNKFKECLNKLMNASSLDDFVNNNLSDLMYNLKEAYGDKFGFYIEDNGEWAGLQTLSEFIRSCKKNTKYYIGGVLDYHY